MADPSLARAPRRLALLLALAVAAAGLTQLATASTTLAWDNESYSSTSEALLAKLHNQARASAGLKALRIDTTLRSIARSRSKDMIVRDYFSHSIPPAGKNVFSVMQAKGFCFVIAGENIGWNNYPDDVATAAINKAFLDSSGHRANILGKKWDVMAVGAYKGPTGKKMWTVLFADKCGSSGGGTPTPTPKPKPKPTPAATPRPTPKPTRAPTPEPVASPSPEPSPSPSPSPEASPSPSPSNADTPPGEGSPDPGSGDGSSPDPGDGSDPGDGTDPGDASPPLGVIDGPPAQGLVESIVGDVAGFYLGD